MGGLYYKIPITYCFVILGSLALMGIPPLSGYFSKDLILEYAFSLHSFEGNLVYYLGCLGAAMTSVYSARLIYLTFHGKRKIKSESFSDIKEAPKVMLLPVFVLSIGAVFSGYFFYDLVKYKSFWKGSIFFKEDINFVEQAHHIHLIYKVFPIFVVILFSLFVIVYFKKFKNLFVSKNKIIYLFLNILKNKWYFDQVYNYLFIRKLISFSNLLWKAIDIRVIDGFGPIGISSGIYLLSKNLKKVQNGKIFIYTTFMMLGIILFFILIFINF